MAILNISVVKKHTAPVTIYTAAAYSTAGPQVIFSRSENKYAYNGPCLDCMHIHLGCKLHKIAYTLLHLNLHKPERCKRATHKDAIQNERASQASKKLT